MNATQGYRLRQVFRRSHRSDAYFSHFDRIASLPLEAVGIFAALKKAVGQPDGGILDVGCGLGYVAQGLGASLAVDPERRTRSSAPGSSSPRCPLRCVGRGSWPMAAVSMPSFASTF